MKKKLMKLNQKISKYLEENRVSLLITLVIYLSVTFNLLGDLTSLNWVMFKLTLDNIVYIVPVFLLTKYINNKEKVFCFSFIFYRFMFLLLYYYYFLESADISSFYGNLNSSSNSMLLAILGTFVPITSKVINNIMHNESE